MAVFPSFLFRLRKVSIRLSKVSIRLSSSKRSTNKNKAMRAKKFLVPNLSSEIENKNGDKSGSNRRGTKTPMTK